MGLDNTVRIGRTPYRLALMLANKLLNTGGLAISGTKTKVKIANTIYAQIFDSVVKKTTADMAVLAGTVTNAKFNVFVFFVNEAGTFRTAMGTEAATLAAVVFPAKVDDEAVIGFVIINPTGTGNFVGATTDLDDATVVPNAVYIDTPFPFDPTWAADCIIT